MRILPFHLSGYIHSSSELTPSLTRSHEKSPLTHRRRVCIESRYTSMTIIACECENHNETISVASV